MKQVRDTLHARHMAMATKKGDQSLYLRVSLIKNRSQNLAGLKLSSGAGHGAISRASAEVGLETAKRCKAPGRMKVARRAADHGAMTGPTA